jgi:hypothetical protein
MGIGARVRPRCSNRTSRHRRRSPLTELLTTVQARLALLPQALGLLPRPAPWLWPCARAATAGARAPRARAHLSGPGPRSGHRLTGPNSLLKQRRDMSIICTRRTVLMESHDDQLSSLTANTGHIHYTVVRIIQ